MCVRFLNIDRSNKCVCNAITRRMSIDLKDRAKRISKSKCIFNIRKGMFMENNISRIEDNIGRQIKYFIPFNPKGYPRKTNLFSLGSNLVLL